MKKKILIIGLTLFSTVSFSQTWVPDALNEALFPINSTTSLNPIKVGIGTNQPTDQLHTTGGVRFEGIVNNMDPDRVVVISPDGTLYWRDINTSNNGNFWGLNGNTGTIPGTGSGQNYLGTTDNNRLVIATNAAERMTVLNSSGNVGIARPNPETRLHIDSGMVRIQGAIPSSSLSSTNFFNGGPGTGLQLRNESDFFGMLLENRGATDDHDAVLYWGDNPGNENLKFCRTNWNTPTFSVHNFVELMRLSAAGNLGIGTNNPTQRLVVFNGTSTGSYTTAGWAHSSDARLKINVNGIEHATEIIKQLNGIYYNWKEDNNSGRQIGFLAQDVQKVLPEVVVGEEGDVEKGETLGIVYQNIIPVLVEAIKEKDKELMDLKQRVSMLEQYVFTENKSGAEEQSIRLGQNVPNPFSTSTLVQYSIPERGEVSLDLFSIDGLKIKNIEHSTKEKGNHQAIIEGTGLEPGTYIYIISLNGKQVGKKAIKI